MSDDNLADLEALFYKIDVEGLDYTLENYPELFDVLPADVRDIAELAADVLARLGQKLDQIRDDHDIEVS